MDKHKEAVLKQIAAKLNDHHVLWGVGASLLLYHHRLVDDFHDIDLMVAPKDALLADELMASLGRRVAHPPSPIFQTEVFSSFEIDGVDVDMMSGFCILNEMGLYHYHFDDASVPDGFFVKGVYVPLTSLEDWYILYLVMPGRQEKARLIREYLFIKGLSHPDLLARMLHPQLPHDIEEQGKLLLHGIKK